MMTGILRMGGLFLAVSFLLFGPAALQRDLLSLAAESQDFQLVTLKVDGMGCGSCVKEVRSALLKVPGVRAAEVKVKKSWFFFNDYSDARAIVTFEQGKTTVADVIKAVEAASNSMFTYKARLIE